MSTLRVAVALFVVFTIACFVVSFWAGSPPIVSGAAQRAPQQKYSLVMFSNLYDGITLEAAEKVLGASGQLTARNNIAGYVTESYSWANRDGSNMQVMFQNGKMIQKAQFGLR